LTLFSHFLIYITNNISYSFNKNTLLLFDIAVRIHCKDDSDCTANKLLVGCRLQREIPRCIDL